MISDLLYRLRKLLRRREAEMELDDELRFHLEREAEKHCASGMPPQDARRRARLGLGGLEQVKESCRDARGTRWLEDFAQDLRYALRTVRKNAAFASIAAATIALGIGASTAIFSVADAVLLRPLPYPHPDRLVLGDQMVSQSDFFDLRDGTHAVFEEVSAMMSFRAVVPREDGSAERIGKGLAMTNFLPMMGARIALGRGFTEADGQPHAGPPGPVFPWPEGEVAILSYEYWQRRYHGDRAVVGKEMLSLGRRGPRIVGVLAKGFPLLLPAHMRSEPTADVWIPDNRGYDAANRGDKFLRVVGRLKAGVTAEQARAAVHAFSVRWRSEHPAEPDSGFDVELEPWHKALAADARPAIVALMGAVIFLTLIAAANVANLLLVRTSARSRELAVRAALGARKGRLVRQMLAEALLLSGVGTLLGLALGWLGIRELLAIAPRNLPRLESVGIDWRVLAFAAGAGLLEAMVFGVLSGLRPARPAVMQILRGGGRTAGAGSGRWLRNGVIVAEVALSFVLLIGSGLMLRSFLALHRVELGYQPHGLLTFLAVGDARGYLDPQRRLAFLRELQGRLAALPGVESVSAAGALPLNGGFGRGTPWGTEEVRTDPGKMRTAALAYVLPGYFETLRARLIEGRTFTGADNAPRRNVAVVDEYLARQAFPGESAVGKRIFIPFTDPQWVEVIGVVGRQRMYSLSAPGPQQIFLTDGFIGIGISRNWALRTAGDPAKYAAAARSEIARFAPGRLAVTEVQTMDDIVDRAGAATRFQFLLIAIFAGMAALLASVGLYGVLATVVRQRTSEIGVRMAFGAAPGGIFRMVVGHGMRLSMAGVAIGIGAAFWLTRWMSSMLVGVTPTDPATFAVVAVVFLAIAAMASWAPARRAASLDPAAALREE